MGNMLSGEGILFIMKCLLFSYVLTAGLLLLLALLLYRFSLQEKIVNIGIIVIYIAVTFLAGLLAGKRAGSRKFLWGLCMGTLYFAVLALVSLAVNRSIADVATNFVTVFCLCAGSGMLGGMLAH
jgi:putative membrane protein (TIGR04086 family)